MITNTFNNLIMSNQATSTITKNATNVELKEAFGEELNDGKARIFAAIPSANNEQRVTLFICQQIETQTNANAAQQLLLGWGSGTRIIRTVFSAEKSIVETQGFKVGSVLPLDILVEEKTEKAYDTQTPKIIPSTGEVITHQGMPVYEHSSLVLAGEGGKVITLPRDTEDSNQGELPGANLLG